MCDNYNDCLGGDDEMNCETTTTQLNKPNIAPVANPKAKPNITTQTPTALHGTTTKSSVTIIPTETPTYIHSNPTTVSTESQASTKPTTQGTTPQRSTTTEGFQTNGTY